jgi:hypothetical protein
VRNRRLGQRVRDRDVEVERGLQVPRLGRWERPGHRAADVVDHDVQPPELRDRGTGESRRGVQVAQVGGDHQGAAPCRLHLVRDLGQLVRAAGTDHHVRSGLRQGDDGGRAEPPARAGHHGHPPGDTE